ncbi:hypothetical protein DNTS_021467 [Danionella cerebrum]|uniref:Transmembrane protein 220 n=1 Tax=Danionella cerebrum TaxID=2873325 RepID=A0A553R2N5_9TELE|nr:hypothetical protein DNTS_021467 [Danionella translucida]
MIWRVCNLLMSVFFSLAAYVQINDPDAAVWMVGYSIPAGLCFLVCCRPQITGQRVKVLLKSTSDGISLHRIFTVMYLIICAEWLLWRRLADLHVLVSSSFGLILAWKVYQEGITDIFQQEEGRESCGLLLTAFWLLLSRRSGRSAVGVMRVCTAAGITAFPFVTWSYYYLHSELRRHWPEHCTTAV